MYSASDLILIMNVTTFDIDEEQKTNFHKIKKN